MTEGNREKSGSGPGWDGLTGMQTGMEGWMKWMSEERAVTETLLMMYRWPVSVPSPHQ